MAQFLIAFDVVTRAARSAPGFRWQLETAGLGHPVVSVDDPVSVVSLSVWADYGSLHSFVYRDVHGSVLLRRSTWFVPVQQPSTALWWITENHLPTMDEALARLTYLRRYGPTPRSFSLTRRFDPSGRPVRSRRHRQA